ncbi:alpha/beta fold hydrolase [Sphingorhabdus pulchriflava]|uniref:Alpha/beta fold hydrolase n=1 Tax=Sphingorhabdus pulchriflava TaxID=2292257 RepID=A0A371BG86_9SPHN|nr:alpha/beta fold hydrolase [Sphingorhabdus pulchriflava]RDV06612.1 alpha/beta fold hydrolase [Sphingorhabdus pulchriflava]
MTYVREFKGFAGIRLEADDIGSADDPSIILLHGAGQTRQVWEDVAVALQQAGRHVINIDLRGHGGSEWPEDGRYDFDAYVEDLRAVLAQMRTRPVVVAATLGGWIATIALAEEAATLAAGLVLVDLPMTNDPDVTRTMAEKLRNLATTRVGKPDYDVRFFDRFDMSGVIDRINSAASQINIPVLFVCGARSNLTGGAQAASFVNQLPDVEAIEVEDSGLLVTAERTENFNALLIDFLERKHPRFVSEFREGSDARTFRDALGCFATGVTIITAMAPDGSPIGLTANSFTSVSLDPPLLLVCIANNAGSGPVLREAERFAVNVLQIGQQPTSNRFAGKGEDRFAATPWEMGEFGTPVLTGSLSSFECARDAVHDGGDHFILVGRVLKAMFEPRRDPLLYFRGKYRRLHFA